MSTKPRRALIGDNGLPVLCSKCGTDSLDANMLWDGYKYICAGCYFLIDPLPLGKGAEFLNGIRAIDKEIMKACGLKKAPKGKEA